MIEETNNKSELNKPTIEEKKLKFEKYKYNIEIVKWFIVSVALVIIALIIDKGFKERTAGIQEMQAYDKYVDVILKADNIESRWKLSEYFSIVTPTKRLRDRWIAYNDSISSDYLVYKKLKEEEEKLINNDTSINSEDALINVQKEIAKYNKKLIGSNSIKDFKSAQYWEEKGFEYLLKKEVKNAITSFRNSENAYNSFHQVYEIANYLNDHKLELEDEKSKFWNIAYRKVATDFSWKMPSYIKTELLNKSKTL